MRNLFILRLLTKLVIPTDYVSELIFEAHLSHHAGSVVC